MELCVLNLNDYIYRTENYLRHASALLNEPTFVVEDSSMHSKLINIWTIIDHVAQGLEIHTPKALHTQGLETPEQYLH